MVELEENILGSLMSSLVCDNNDFEKQYVDDIDECNNFVRVEECSHYRVNMTRTRIKDKVFVNVKFECAKCKKEQEKSSQNVEDKFEFECCGQKKIIYSYSISFNQNNITQIKEREDDVDKYIENIDVYPWPNIADDNKIVLIFKYLKKTNIHYKMHCSKHNYFNEVLRAFKEKNHINNPIYPICNGRMIDTSKKIFQLELKNESLVLLS